MKNQYSSCQVQSLGASDFEDVVQEIRERERRKCNVMLYGLAEEASVSVGERREKDDSVCQAIFSKLAVPSDTAYVRLGKFDPSRPRPRPIRITLKDEHQVRALLRGSRNAFQDTKFKDIRFANDQTPRQQQHYKDLKSELTRRVGTGEQLIIKYVKGIPKIVSGN